MRNLCISHLKILKLHFYKRNVIDLKLSNQFDSLFNFKVSIQYMKFSNNEVKYSGFIK